MACRISFCQAHNAMRQRRTFSNDIIVLLCTNVLLGTSACKCHHAGSNPQTTTGMISLYFLSLTASIRITRISQKRHGATSTETALLLVATKNKGASIPRSNKNCSQPHLQDSGVLAGGGGVYTS